MRVLFQDYETFYGPVVIPGSGGLTKTGKPRKDKTFNLSLRNTKLSMSEYIRHPEFEVLGVSLKWADEKETKFLRAHEIPEAYSKIDWSNTIVVAHNALFEGLINFEKYGVVPARYFCTLACAEALFQGSTRVGLEDLAQLFGLGSKLPFLKDFVGLHAKDLTEDQWAILKQYCDNDIALTEPLYNILSPELPQAEKDLMNHTLMLFAHPVLKIDVPLAREALQDAVAERAALVKKTGLKEEEISSDLTFAKALEAKLGWYPQKINKNGELKPAFAKTDAEFVKLKSNPDESVRDLVAARQEVKSSLAITRAQRLIRIGETGTRLLPVGLHYARAHTLRWTGGNKINLQNLTRGSKLRRSIVAPPGYRLVIVDSSQIECRTNAVVAGEEYLIQLFVDGEDPYNHMAMKVFGGGPYGKKSDERFMGKTMVLALGYGMGWRKFYNEIITGARGKAMPITPEFAERAVKVFRHTNRKIVNLWWFCNDELLPYLAFGKEPREFLDGLLTLDPVNKKIIFPNGCYLRYPELRWDDDAKAYIYRTQKKGKYFWKKIYGGLLVENIIQSIARHVVASQILKIGERYRLVLFVHDECVFLVKEDEVEEAQRFALEKFRENTDWINIPLDAECGHDVCYSK